MIYEDPFWREGVRQCERCTFSCTHVEADGDYCARNIPQGEVAYFPGIGGGIECMSHQRFSERTLRDSSIPVLSRLVAADEWESVLVGWIFEARGRFHTTRAKQDAARVRRLEMLRKRLRAAQ